jgi:hypothetical protein
MCLVNLVGQILESNVEDDDGGGARDIVESLVAPLQLMPASEAKTLCVAKLQILVEPV